MKPTTNIKKRKTWLLRLSELQNVGLRKNIASNIKSIPKAFYKYIKHKTKNKQDITALKVDKGTFTSTDEKIAELLNEYFSTVFTNELTNSITSPELTQIQEPMAFDPNSLNKNQVKNLLKAIYPKKSNGPDDTHPEILKKLSR